MHSTAQRVNFLGLRGIAMLFALPGAIACVEQTSEPSPSPPAGSWAPMHPAPSASPTSPVPPTPADPVGDAGADATAPADAALAKRRPVVILSLDGCRPDALTWSRTRNIMRFAAEGSRASRAFTIPLSLTLPSHSSMLSGYDMEHHGVTWNTPVPQNGYIKVPTIFAVAKATGLRTVMVMGKGKFLTLQLPDSLDEVHEVGGDEEGITDTAMFVARRKNFDLMFIHFPNPDLIGHIEGWMSAPYLDRVSKIDVLFGRLLAALPPETTVIVTADHGGRDLGHGADIEVDRHIPWMIRGPNIRKGHVFSRRIETMDTAATALKVLGLSLQDGAQGQVVQEVFSK